MSETRVAREYVDARGERRSAAPETVQRFEALLGEAPHGIAPPTVMLYEDETFAVDVTLPAMSWPESLRWMLLREDGNRDEGVVPLREAPVVGVDHRAESTYDTRRVALGPPLPLGVHRLTLDVAAYARAGVHVAVVPRRAYPPAGRTWGITLQLYALRSARNDGIGDFADLRSVCALLGERGASYVGINPLHAPFRSDPEDASPYAASSRRWLNWLAIAVDEVPEAHDPTVRGLLTDPRRAARVAALRAATHVDYSGVAAAKEEALRACWDALGRDARRRAAFEAWRDAQGEALERFAAFDMLVARYGRTIATWPPTFRTPNSPDVALLAAAQRPEIEYAMYLQWLAEEQLAAVAADAATHGVRLYRDLAVGVDANAADVWSSGESYVEEVSVGAPPDVLNPLGQDWGLPALDPRGLAREGYAELLAVLRANCRHAGALRIDHAFALQRLYWIPRGSGPSAGAYVLYPFEELRGIVALASASERCVIVGEDLGTVPPGFQERMGESGILSYRILLFERNEDGSFLAPEEYPGLALAASGTHDLPTLGAWLHGEDITLRDRLGLLGTPVREELAQRERDRTLLLDALVDHGDLAPAERDDESAVVVAANRYLAAAPSAIVMAQLDDVLGEREPLNVPGTSTQYPNWRRKLGTEVDALAGDARLRRLCDTLREIRPKVLS